MKTEVCKRDGNRERVRQSGGNLRDESSAGLEARGLH